MKQIDVITLFPELFESFLKMGILGRAGRRGQVLIKTIPLRDYGLGRHKRVDDVPYGGAPGMLLAAEPVIAAIEARTAWYRAHGTAVRRILLTPHGQRHDQAQARELAETDQALILICGRYEGIDHRVQANWVDQCCSIGDFICFGGEIPAMALIESVVRLLPSVLGNNQSAQEESFSEPDVLECPQYTRPAKVRNHAVPAVLMSGNHQQIADWRAQYRVKHSKTG